MTLSDSTMACSRSISGFTGFPISSKRVVSSSQASHNELSAQAYSIPSKSKILLSGAQDAYPALEQESNNLGIDGDVAAIR